MDTCVQKINISDKEIYENIDILNRVLWGGKVIKPNIQEWLDNFVEKQEKDSALFLLSKCMYFNKLSIRNLLKALFRDKYRTPILREIRECNERTLDEEKIEKEFIDYLNKTRFIGVGKPAESGSHLLYEFRQENKIRNNLFVSTENLLKDKRDVKHVVFIDDLCGSGMQIQTDKSLSVCINELRKQQDCPKISYLMLFGTTAGIQHVRDLTLNGNGLKWFDEVDAEVELNESYKCFGAQSRYFDDNEKKYRSEEMCRKYGIKLIDKIADRDFVKPLTGEERDNYVNSCSLGYGDCQLLFSMEHNTPNNTLPIFWFEEDGDDWKPIFKRYNKVYK